MTEKEIQILLENNPDLINYKIGKCIKSEFIQQNNKRLDSLFENKNERFVVEYQLNNLDLDHISRGIVYFNNETNNNPKFKHNLFFVSTKKPQLAELEFLEFNSKLINIKTFIFNEKIKSFEEYCFKQCHQEKVNKLIELKNKPKTNTKFPPKKPTWSKQFSFFQDSDSEDDIVTEFKYQDFFYKKEFELLKQFLKNNLKILIKKRVPLFAPDEYIKSIPFNPNFKFSDLNKNEDFEVFLELNIINENQEYLFNIDSFLDYMSAKRSVRLGHNFCSYYINRHDKKAKIDINFKNKFVSLYINEYINGFKDFNENYTNFINNKF